MQGFHRITLLLAFASFLGRKVESGELYDYYVGDGITTGLTEDGPDFHLNGKYIQLVSGSLHYFRVHPGYWRESLRKMRACGLNAVTTYVPWNLHEPAMDRYEILPLADFLEFIRIAAEEDLFVIIRPGPYICSEWEFGGLPSYLLRDPDMVVRTSYSPYLDRVQRYFEFLIPLLAEYQWRPGTPGPIIAAQVENEYGVFPETNAEPDTEYLIYVRDLMVTNGLDQVLYFTSDTPTQYEDRGAIPGVLMTANFRGEAREELEKLQELQPGRPSWVMELWVGWFDQWMGGFHHTVPIQTVMGDVSETFELFNGSVNMYMFQGGSTRGFMSGANRFDFFPNYLPQVSSYDYDAPLTEAGDYTDKYDAVCEYIQENMMGPNIPLPLRPPETLKFQYPTVALGEFLSFDNFIHQGLPMMESATLLSMENLNVNNGSGQSFGFVIYRKTNMNEGNGVLTIQERGKDKTIVLMDGIEQTPPFTSIISAFDPGQWNSEGGDVSIEGNPNVPNGEHWLDVIVENTGRVNYGKARDFRERKGLFEAPLLWNGVELSDWSIYSLELHPDWLSSLEGWGPTRCESGPCLARATFEVTGTPMDTWVHVFAEADHWVKGMVIVNGLNLGRFWDMGPTDTLYVPAPLLRTGTNEIFVLDLHDIGTEVNFSAVPIL